MPLTTRGYPTPADAPGVPNDVPGDLLALAAAINDDVAGVTVDYQKKVLALSGFVTASQTTVSTAYTDLVTVGPSVTVNLSEPRVVLIVVGALLRSDTVNRVAFMSWALTGATVLAAADNWSLQMKSDVAGQHIAASRAEITNLSAGITTITAKYKVNAGTALFADRRMQVLIF